MSAFWKVIAGPSNQYVRDFEEKSCIAVGWVEMGDLSKVRSPDELATLYDATYPNESAVTRGIQFGGITKFRFGMKPGDAVISYDPSTREYLWGTIVGEYYYKPGFLGDYPNIRNVEWKGRIKRDDLSRSTRNRLTVLLTIIQPSDDVRKEMEAVLAGQKETPATEELDPEVILETQEEKAHELIKDKLSGLDWKEMQALVAAILRAMGYKTRISPAGPDKGKDVVASPDGLGLEEPRIKVEIKHQKGQMGSAEVRSFLGGLRPGDKGLYVSSGGFSKEAEYEAERAVIPLTLVDLEALAALLVQHYDQLDTEGRALMPLTRIFWPAV